ncbi:MAG: PIN/TRAM domain-containing protein [Firmicutes bacterium]|nr:PIN/TRAM domain-containing protein [Bacillota bacterium]
MLKKLFRVVLTLCGLLLGYGIASLIISHQWMQSLLGEGLSFSEAQAGGITICSAFLFALIFYNLAPMFTKQGQKVARGIEKDLQTVPSTDIATGSIGLIVGLVIAFFISQLINNIELLQYAYLNVIISVMLYVFFGYLGMSLGRRGGNDLRLQVLNTTKKMPKVGRAGKGRDASPKILDTSVIIDGRIADIMKTGFIEGDIVIPSFVLVELRHIADSSDGLKRNRGRRGLDILNKIQTDYGIEIYNTDSEKALEAIPEVDVKLLKLAQIMNGKVVTNDFNLNKVAMIQGVPVLNINELANTLKPVVLPGEDMQVFLVKEGKENNQAIAYLDDGTMIVVEEGKKHIGKTVDVLVTSVLQTSAGRMIFAKIRK